MSKDLKILEDRANKVSNHELRHMLHMGLDSMRVFEEGIDSSNVEKYTFYQIAFRKSSFRTNRVKTIVRNSKIS